MAAQNVALLGFNRGLVSRLALARTDLKRTALSAEIMVNWMPRVLGTMMLRPGTGFLGDTLDDAAAKYLEFVFSLTDTALIELTDQMMRVWVGDALVTRPAVASAITNGTFAASFAGWTDLDEGAAASTWVGPGLAQFQGTGIDSAIREQQVVVAAGDLGVEHALRIVVIQGVLTLRVGSSSGDDDLITQTDLDVGTHSLALTPAGNFFVRFSSSLARVAFLQSCVIEGPGALELPTPWVEADLGRIRKDQSGDILFLTCSGSQSYQQKSIERRGVHSWSVVRYSPNDGPFRVQNVTPITLQPSVLTGNGTLNASKAIFRSNHVGALFRVTSVGQNVNSVFGGDNQFTNPIKVTGVGTDRAFAVIIRGLTATGTTVSMQQSLDMGVTWVDTTTYTDDVSTNTNDGLDNQIIFYRLGIELGNYVAGNPNCTLQTGSGSLTGICRVIAIASGTQADIEVLTPFGDVVASDVWSEGEWSDFRGFPSAVGLAQGRLWFAGKGMEWGSVSDGFYSFDDTVVGDSGPISRTIGSGPIDNINWILAAQRLLLGGDMAEFENITSTLDEPITPTNFNLRSASTYGSANVQAVKVDAQAMYASRSGTRLMQLAIDPYLGDYASTDITAIVPELFESRLAPAADLSIQRMAVQRLPDTRIHCIRADGQAGVLIFDKVENVMCWVQVQTDGEIEDVVVLPGTPEDQVYYVVRRTIAGAQKRFLERWAMELEARGAPITKLADAYIVVTNATPQTVINIPHLEGKEVAVLADGVDVGTNPDFSYIYTVAGGEIVLAAPATTVIVGLPYMAQWQSAKLAYAAQLGTALAQVKTVPGLGVIMADTHAQGLRYGKDFDSLDPLPLMEDNAPVPPNFIWNEYDKPSFEFDGTWDTDSRVCLQAQSPRPCTLLALVATVEVSEKT